jgi:hypothetical protein
VGIEAMVAQKRETCKLIAGRVLEKKIFGKFASPIST